MAWGVSASIRTSLGHSPDDWFALVILNFIISHGRSDQKGAGNLVTSGFGIIAKAEGVDG